MRIGRILRAIRVKTKPFCGFGAVDAEGVLHGEGEFCLCVEGDLAADGGGEPFIGVAACYNIDWGYEIIGECVGGGVAEEVAVGDGGEGKETEVGSDGLVEDVERYWVGVRRSIKSVQEELLPSRRHCNEPLGS